MPTTPMDTALQGFDAMRRVQETAVAASFARHAASLTPAAAFDPARFAWIQAELLQQDALDAARSWQEIAAALLEAQSEFAACCTRWLDSAGALEAAGALGH